MQDRVTLTLLSVGQYLSTDYVLVKYSTRPGDATRLRDSRVIAPRSIKAGHFRDWYCTSCTSTFYHHIDSIERVPVFELCVGDRDQKYTVAEL